MKGEWIEAKGEKLDFSGSLFYAVSIFSFIYGLSLLPGSYAIWLIAGGITGLAGFSFWELRIKNPILNIRLFTNNAVFTFSNIAALLNYSATFAIGFLLSYYLQYIMHLEPQYAGAVLLSQPIVQAIFSPLAGKLSDKIEPRIVTTAGMSLTVIGLILLGFIGRNPSVIYIIFCLMLLGFSFALFSSPNTNSIMSSVDKKFYSFASSILGTMRLTGQMISMAIVMILLSLFIGKVQITEANLNSLARMTHIAFFVFALLCFSGIFASLSRGKLRQNDSGDK